MRAAALAFVLLLSSSAVAVAQTNTYQAAPNATPQILQPNLLNGVWRIGSLGDVTITARPDGVLEGVMAGRACHGQYLDNAFSLLCPSEGRGPFLISGQVAAVAPTNTTARARILGGGARMTGQIHQSYLTSRGHTEEIGTFTANRQ
jgi:hypothetical protein